MGKASEKLLGSIKTFFAFLKSKHNLNRMIRREKLPAHAWLRHFEPQWFAINLTFSLTVGLALLYRIKSETDRERSD